jgi:hypothetical protein
MYSLFELKLAGFLKEAVRDREVPQMVDVFCGDGPEMMARRGEGRGTLVDGAQGGRRAPTR